MDIVTPCYIPTLRLLLLLGSRKPLMHSHNAIPTALISAMLSMGAQADCVIDAKSATAFVILDAHTIVLKGGVGKDILLKTFHFFQNGSQVTVLKDSFCDYENAVLYVDGQTVDIQQAKSF